MVITDNLENQSKPASVPPPVTTTETEFPFHKLEWNEFECLCRDIAQAHGFTNVHRYGISGQAQEGIDYTGDSPTGECTAFQVKQMKELTASDLQDIVENLPKVRWLIVPTSLLSACQGRQTIGSSWTSSRS